VHDSVVVEIAGEAGSQGSHLQEMVPDLGCLLCCTILVAASSGRCWR